MSVANSKDFWSGVVFILTGAFFIYFAQEHEMGTAARMGPAYFPTILGGALSFLGAIVALRGMLIRPVDPEEAKIEPYDWRVIVLILGSVFVFSLLLAFCGLMISLAAMIIVAAFADKGSRVKETLILIAVMDILAYVIFVYGIGMLVPVWPTFIFGS